MRADRTETPATGPGTQTGSPTRAASRHRGRVQTFSSLRSKDYRLLWVGNIFDHMALWLQMITLSWLVWDLTGSALLSGTAAGLRGFPTLIIGPWAGVVADRIDRRKVVIVVQFFLSIVAFGFALMVATATVEVWHAFAYAGVSAVCFAFIMPARSALVVNTVPPGDLGNAFALNAMTVTVNRLIGGMLGGLLITEVGITWNFLVEGVSYLAAAFLLIPHAHPLPGRVYRPARLGAEQPEERVPLHLAGKPDHPSPYNNELHTDLLFHTVARAAPCLRRGSAWGRGQCGRIT